MNKLIDAVRDDIIVDLETGALELMTDHDTVEDALSEHISKILSALWTDYDAEEESTWPDDGEYFCQMKHGGFDVLGFDEKRVRQWERMGVLRYLNPADLKEMV